MPESFLELFFIDFIELFLRKRYFKVIWEKQKIYPAWKDLGRSLSQKVFKSPKAYSVVKARLPTTGVERPWGKWNIEIKFDISQIKL
jgi:hypothetical protein